MLPVSTAENYEAVLIEHEGTENPPTFLFPCLNGREQRELLLFREGIGGTAGVAALDALFAKVESYLLGWKNMGIDYSKGQLMEVINYIQCTQLLALLTYQGPNRASKKKSKSPSPSNTVKPAKPAKGQNVSGSSPNTPAGT